MKNTLQPHTDSEPHFQATNRPYYHIFKTSHVHTFAALTPGDGLEITITYRKHYEILRVPDHSPAIQLNTVNRTGVT